MLQVELFNYSTLNELKKRQNEWLKDMGKRHGEGFKTIEFLQSGEPEFGKRDDAIFVFISIYYTIS